MSEKIKSKWGIGIALLYGSFVIFILGIVVLASLQDFQMVEDNYYDKELVYQKHIDKVNRTEQLKSKLKVEQNTNSGLITITFPTLGSQASVSGTILFFRPSDAAMDKKIEISVDQFSQQEIDLGSLEKGRWKMMIYWQVDSTDYFNQEELYIQ